MIWFMNALGLSARHRRQADVQPVLRLSAVYELTILFGSFGALLGMLVPEPPAAAASSAAEEPAVRAAPATTAFSW